MAQTKGYSVKKIQSKYYVIFNTSTGIEVLMSDPIDTRYAANKALTKKALDHLMLFI